MFCCLAVPEQLDPFLPLHFFKASPEANLSRSNLSFVGREVLFILCYLHMKLPGCASPFPLVAKCLCYSIFAFLCNKLEKLSGMQFKELGKVLLPTLLSGEKVSKPSRGPGPGGGTPVGGKRKSRWAQRLVPASVGPARSPKFPVREKAQQGDMARDGAAGWGWDIGGFFWSL